MNNINNRSLFLESEIKRIRAALKFFRLPYVPFTLFSEIFWHPIAGVGTVSELKSLARTNNYFLIKALLDWYERNEFSEQPIDPKVKAVMDLWSNLDDALNGIISSVRHTHESDLDNLMNKFEESLRDYVNPAQASVTETEGACK